MTGFRPNAGARSAGSPITGKDQPMTTEQHENENADKAAPRTVGVQREFDDLARRNSWQVETSSGESVYVRGAETVTLRFNEAGTVLTGADRTVPFDLSAKDWRGQVGNILRRRWRTYEAAAGNLGAGQETAR